MKGSIEELKKKFANLGTGQFVESGLGWCWASDVALKDLKDCQDAYNQGNTLMLFEALRRCAQYRIAAPSWVREELESGLRRWSDWEVREFGEAFNIPHRKGAHLEQIQRRLKRFDGMPLIARIFNFIYRRNEEEPLSELWPAAAKKFSVSEGDAKNLYYEYLNMLKRHSEKY